MVAVPPDEPRRRRVEIVHESLLKNWPRLVRWQAQDADSAQLRDELRQAAQLWEQHGRADDYLWSGTAYRETQVWRDRYPGGLTELEQEFARAMATNALSRLRRQRTAVAVAFVALLSGLAVVSFYWRQSERLHRESDAAALRAEAARLLALGELALASDPTSALAYATKSLAMNDDHATRRFVMKALWQGPPAYLDETSESGPIVLEFSSDSSWLGSCAIDYSLAIRRREGGGPIQLGRHQEATYPRVDVTKDGLIASKSPDNPVLHLWSPASRGEVASLDVGKGATWLVSDHLFALSEEGDHLRARRWSIEDSTFRETCTGTMRLDGRSETKLLTLDAHGSRAAWVERGWLRTRTIDGCEGGPVHTLGESARDLVGLALPSNREWLVSLDADGELRKWCIEASGCAAGQIAPPRRSRQGITLSETGRWLAVASDPLIFEVFDLEGPDSEPLILHPPLARTTYSMSIAPDGAWLAGAHGKGLRMWPLGGRRSYTLPGGSDRERLKFLSRDAASAVAADDPKSRVIQLPRSMASEETALLAYQWDDRVDEQAQRVIVSSGTKIRLLSVTNQGASELSGIPGDVEPLPVALSVDGRFAAVGIRAGPADRKMIHVWDLEEGGHRILGPVPGAGPGYDGGVVDLAFAWDGRLVSGGESGVFVWSLQDGSSRLIEDRAREGKWATQFEFLPDRRHVMTRALISKADLKVVVRLIDLETGESTEIAGHPDAGPHAIDSTGSILVSGSLLTGEIRVSRLGSGGPHLLIGHDAGVHSLAIDPSGRWIASVDDGRTVRLWPMPDLNTPPLHMLPRDELIAKLESLTNLRVVRDPDTPGEWKTSIDPFPGWKEVPSW